MNLKSVRIPVLAVFAMAIVLSGFTHAGAEELRIAIMQAQKGAAEKLAPLEDYLETKDIYVELVPTSGYSEAAHMFAEGKVDAMFSGSGVAGTMIIKNVAYPVARPVRSDGVSTYWAMVVAPAGSEEFTHQADYFEGKRVVFCALASSGEFFFRSIPGAVDAAASTRIAPSHQAAVEAVASGAADVAIVKNLVWNDLEERFPDLAAVGSDPGQNPNNALIVSRQTSKAFVKRLTAALLGLQEDESSEAQAVREKMNIMGFVITSGADFRHTLSLLKKAGVDPAFDFHF